MKMAWPKLPRASQVSTKSYGSPRLNVKSEASLSISESIPAAAEVYPIPKVGRLKIEAKKEPRPFKWKSVLFALAFFGVSAGAVYATKNWFQSRSHIQALQTALERLHRYIFFIQEQKGLLSQRALKMENVLHQKNKKIRTLQWDKRNLEREFFYAKSKINSLKSKMKELSAANSAFQLKPSVQGIIVRVNPVYEYAMIDLGKEQGIEEGKDLFVIRDGVIQGTLRTDQSFEAFSLCTMHPANPAYFFQSGDRVVE